MNLRIPLLITIIVALSVPRAMAQTEIITFDDLPPAGNGLPQIPTGYSGLQWNASFNSFDYVDPSTFLGGGVVFGAVSQPNAGLINSNFGTITASRPFTLVSLYLTDAVGNNNVPITISGLSGGIVIDTQNGTLSGTTPQLFTLNFTGITEIQFNTNEATSLDNLDLSFGTTFAATPGLTPNQETIAANIDANSSAPSPNIAAIIAALQSLAPSALPGAISQLSPQKFGQFTSMTAFNNASFSTEEMDNYLAGRRAGPNGTFVGGNGGIDTSGLTVNDPSYDPNLAMVHSRLMAWNAGPLDGTVSDIGGPLLGGVEMKDSKEMKSTCYSANTNPWNFFVQGNVILAQGFSQADVPHFDDNTESVTIGADYRVTQNFLIGLSAGYGHTDATLDNDGSSATVDSYSPGIYASYADHGWYAESFGQLRPQRLYTKPRDRFPGPDGDQRP